MPLISIPVGLATVSSATNIPAGAIVLAAYLDITSAGTAVYSGGATISIGRTGSTALVMTTSQNVPQNAQQYIATQATPWGTSSLPVLVTVGGAPGVGACNALVLYAVPNP